MSPRPGHIRITMQEKEGMREEGGVSAAEAPLMHARDDAAMEWWLRIGKEEGLGLGG